MAGVIAVPTLAFGQSDTAAVVVTDSGFVENSVEIWAGGTVGFSYPSGSGRHNVRFTGQEPASCRQTAGDMWAPHPPLPFYTQWAGWAGDCTFDAPGTYPYRSEGNFSMTGTVVVAATPTPTPSPTPTPTATASPAAIEAKDNWFQDASSSDPADNTVTVGPGGAVTFSYPTGSNVHNVDFDESKPASCVQTAGIPVGGAPPPLPTVSLPAGWAGYCTFAAVGTYTFFCVAHKAEMTGSVIVKEDAPVPTPTPTPEVTPTPTATPTATATATATRTPIAIPIVVVEPPVRDGAPAAVPSAWASIERPAGLSIDRLRRGKLRITARCVSARPGKLKLTVSRAVARRLGLRSATIGSGSGRCDANGRFTLKVRPTAAAKRALKGYRKPIQVTATLRAGRTSDRRTLTLAGKDGL